MHYDDVRYLFEILRSINGNLEEMKAGQERQEELLTEILKALQSKKD
jgi:hypothetical protein